MRQLHQILDQRRPFARIHACNLLNSFTIHNLPPGEYFQSRKKLSGYNLKRMSFSRKQIIGCVAGIFFAGWLVGYFSQPYIIIGSNSHTFKLNRHTGATWEYSYDQRQWAPIKTQ